MRSHIKREVGSEDEAQQTRLVPVTPTPCQQAVQQPVTRILLGAIDIADEGIAALLAGVNLVEDNRHRLSSHYAMDCAEYLLFPDRSLHHSIVRLFFNLSPSTVYGLILCILVSG